MSPHGAAQRVWASASLSEAVFHESIDAIMLASPDGRIHPANAAACQPFGMTEAETRQRGRRA